MASTSSPSPVALSGAPLHSQLHLPDHAMRFEPGLEAEYVRTRLLNCRLLVRMACLLGLLVICLRIGELLLTQAAAPHSPVMLVLPAVVLSTSIVITWLAWSPGFEHRYLRVAVFAVPTRNIFAAIGIAAMAARGQVELLIVLPVMVLSPFFFLGLSFRAGLVCVTLTVAAFTAAALICALPAPVLSRTSGFLLVTAAASAVAAWQLEKQSRRSFLEGKLIAQLAEHDALTGAKNRRVFDEHLARLWQQAIEDGRRLAILLIDVDHFKAYNDRHGHQAGDVALQRVARALQAQTLPPFDVLSRYGGEEFAVLLYDTGAQEAREIAERMRCAVSALDIEHRGSPCGRAVTVSIGVAAIQPVTGRGPVGALQLADEALYKAKVRGRDNVQLATEADYGDLETGVFAQHPASG